MIHKLENLDVNIKKSKITYSLGDVTAIAITIGFVCCLAYNYGFFFDCSVGMSLLAYSDIIGSYSIWIPFVICIVFILYYYKLWVNFLEKSVKDNIKYTYKTNKKEKKAITKLYLDILLFVTLFMFISWLLIGFPAFRNIIFIFLITSCFILASNLYVNKDDITKQYIFIVTFIISILYFMFMLGNGVFFIKTILNSPNATLTLDKDKPLNISVVILRNLENGLLVKIANTETIKLVPWDEIQDIEIRNTSLGRYMGILPKIFVNNKEFPVRKT